MGGHLATIGGPAEQKVVAKALGNLGSAWIGLQLAEGAFGWSTCEPIAFTQFASYRGRAWKGYGALTRGGTWTITSPDARRPFIVEWDEP
jgi:hypothetical protein